MYSALYHVHVCRKDDIFSQRRLNHSGVGGGIAFRRVYPARAYTTLVVLVTFRNARKKTEIDQTFAKGGRGTPLMKNSLEV